MELIDFNSKLKLKVQNIWSTNIILFHPERRKIYDIFKLNVIQQTTFLNQIVVSIGVIIYFLEKIYKKNELNKKGKWIGDNFKIIKVDKNGISTVVVLEDATIFLKE